VTVAIADKLTRTAEPPAALSSAAITAAFTGREGAVATAPGKNPGEQVVLRVTKVEVPPYVAGGPDQLQAREQLGQGIGNDLLAAYVAALQANLGVTVNQTAVQQVVGGTDGS
jgi:peptidyl-prolyl cis-trans isomerase D